MVARLAFATATDVTPDLLLIDEVLSVGDEDFQARSKARTTEMMNGGCAIVLVTHDLRAVQSMATRALYLDHGTMRSTGKPQDVIDAYHADLR